MFAVKFSCNCLYENLIQVSKIPALLCAIFEVQKRFEEKCYTKIVATNSC